MEADAILERIKLLKSLKSEKDLAFLLGLSPQDFSNRKKRNTLRPLVLEWAAREGINATWLICEEGEIYGRQGEEMRNGVLNKDLLRLVIEMVEQGGEELGLHLKANKKAELIVTLYEMHQIQKEIDRQTLLRLVRLAG
jgi:hypothetical protein